MTKKKTTNSDVRENIKVLAIIEALENHIIYGTEMNSTQVSAALALLKKTVHDISTAKDSKTKDISKEEMLKILKKHEDALKELE